MSAASTRYRVQLEEGPSIVAINAPNIRLRWRRGLVVNKQGLKRYGPQAIFLDGVFAGPPFFDNARRRYSLDHHAGCLRSFTLATCEQAAVMLVQGIPLQEGTWTLWINEPDLDALLAVWLLMNHAELLQREQYWLKAAMPLVRLEGVIDAHGLGREILTALPEPELKLQRERIQTLLEPERVLKTSGAWEQTDLTDFTLRQLDAIDRLVFPPEVLQTMIDMGEFGRVRLPDQRLAVLVQSPRGIYEVETGLQERYGKSLALIVLDNGNGRVTLRLTDVFLQRDLKPLYKALNQLDPEARSEDGLDNLWGGSGELGGSPRETGTGLTGEEILSAIGSVYQRHRAWYRRGWDWFLSLRNRPKGS